MEDRGADRADDAVQGIDVAVDPRDAGGGVCDAGQALQADAEGEQFSDDVVVQVEGDAVVIRQSGDSEFGVTAVGQGERDRGVGAEGRPEWDCLIADQKTELWRDTVRQWGGRSAGTEFGPWLFSPGTDHRTRLSTSCLGHWFATLCDDAGLTARRSRYMTAMISL